jgi:glycosyltransferase involved in cell wall biosynthesis
MKHAIRRAHQFVATGEGWRQRFIDRWDVESSKINVIENGTEIVNLLKREQLRAFCERRNLAEAATIVYVGAFEPWHGITILLRAIAKAKAHGKLTKLVIIGTGSEFGRIKLLIGELELEGCVTLIQHLDMHQLATYLTRADIGVSPYCGRVEYSGLKLLDYKAAGLATIASGVNGQPAVIEHGRTGWIVPPCDEDALCQAIIRLASSVELRQQIGQAARAEAEKYHTWRHTAEQLDTVFKQVISSS